MRLVVHCSFEPASLPRVLDHWNARVPLFTALDVRRPEALAWGLASAPATDELHVFMLDRKGMEQATSSAALTSATPPPILVTVPSFDGPAPLLPDGVSCEHIAGDVVFAEADITTPLDAEGYRLAHVPFHESAYVALGTAVFRKAHARLTAEPKVLAVDCDNTLWQGLCAELGPEGVVIGPEERELHAFLLEQKRAGRVLALVSKNVPEDVEAVFTKRPDLGISRGDFAAAKIGWGTKSAALRELAGELSLGLDAFVFIDDSPTECAEVSAALPEVAVLVRPAEDPMPLLRAAWRLDLRAGAAGTLGEARTRMYHDEAQRRAALREAPSYAEHVRDLAVHTEVRVAHREDAGRLFELAQRTNQFNTSAQRPSSAEVNARVADGDVLAVHVRDRFGDYGLSGAVFLRQEAGATAIERWLLSCRVLGRGVEADVFDAVARIARQRGASRLSLRCVRLPRNQPAQRYVGALLAPSAAPEGGGQDTIDATFEVRTLGAAPRLLGEAPAEGGETRSAAPRAPDWNAVAALTRAPRVLATELGLAADGNHGALPVKADRDGILAVIGEVMGRSVGPADNLYALGADSLRMMRILARLRGRLGITIPVGEFLYRADVSHVLALATRSVSDGTAATPVEDEEFVGAFLRELRDDAEPTR